MTPNGFRQLQLNFSGVGCWLTLAIGFGLAATVGVGWILKSLLVLVVLLFLIPVLAVAGAQFWLRRNLVEGTCPACSHPLTGFRPIPLSCPNCGIALQADDGVFTRVAAEGTIDVDVINVDAPYTGTDERDVTIVDVDVLPPSEPQ